MKIKHLFAVSFLFFTAILFAKAQEFNMVSQFKIGGNSNDVAHDIICMTDGGYIIAGSSTSDISGDKDSIGYGSYDIWVVRVDSLGNKLDEIVLGGSGNDNIACMLKISSNRILIGGTSDSPISGTKSAINYGSSDYWVIIINPDNFSDIISQQTFGANQDESLSKVLVTDNSEVILCGQSNSNASGIKSENVIGGDDFWIIKANLINNDSIGEIIWENTIGGNGNEQLRDAVLLPNNKCMVGGYSNSDVSGDKNEPAMAFDFWLVTLDSLGEIVAQNTIGGDESDFLYRMSMDKNNHIIVGGSSYSNLSGDKDENNFVSGQLDYWVLALDTSGIIQWQNTIKGDQTDNLYGDIIVMDNNSYVIAGESFSGNTVGGDKDTPSYGVSDVWMLHLDQFGDIVGQYSIGGVSYEQLRTVKMDSIGNIIIGGSSSSDSTTLITENSFNESSDFWVVKFHIDTLVCVLNPTITPAGPINFCSGSNVLLNAPVEAGWVYQWKKNGVDIAGATNSSYTATTTGNYQVQITNNTCTEISDSLLVTRMQNPSATITNVDLSATNNLCIDPSIKLKANSGAGYTYQWYKGASPLAGATSQIYFAATPGNYKVKVTTVSGCNKTSSTYSIVKPCKEFEEIEKISQLSVFPNPNDGNFTLLFNSECNAELDIEIFDAFGRLIYNEGRNVVNNSFINTYDFSEWTKGVYLIRVNCNDEINYINLIVQ